MAVAVLVQALAVLLIGVVSAVLLLPRPLAWYADRAGKAAGVFFDALAASLTKEHGNASPDTGGLSGVHAEEAAEEAAGPGDRGKARSHDAA